MDGLVDIIVGYVRWDLRGGYWSIWRAVERRD